MRRLAAVLLLCAAAASGRAASVQVVSKPQVPGVYGMQLGDFQVTAMSDGAAPQDLHAIVDNRTRAEVDAPLRPGFVTNPVEASINAYLIDTGSRVVLVDTGALQLPEPAIAVGYDLGSAAAAARDRRRVAVAYLTFPGIDYLRAEGGSAYGWVPVEYRDRAPDAAGVRKSQAN